VKKLLTSKYFLLFLALGAGFLYFLFTMVSLSIIDGYSYAYGIWQKNYSIITFILYTLTALLVTCRIFYNKLKLKNIKLLKILIIAFFASFISVFCIKFIHISAHIINAMLNYPLSDKKVLLSNQLQMVSYILLMLGSLIISTVLIIKEVKRK